MRKKQVIIKGILITGLLIFLFSSCTTKKSEREINQIQELVSFVSTAVELIEKEGEDSFPEFRKKGSKWFHDDLYISIWGLDGIIYVYPPNPPGEGENMIDLKDNNGRPIGRLIVNATSNEKGEGWVHYQWNKPDEEEPTWKSAFIKSVTAPSGKTYLVLSGLYDPKTDKIFIVEAVDDAINLIKKVGISALDTIRAKANEFIFLETYVFIKDIEGNELVNPAFPDLEGQNIYDLQDSNGKYFVREELEILKTKNDCWMDYMWAKPGETTPSQKWVYAKKVIVGQDTLVVGAGYFLESTESEYEFEETRDIVNLVNDAVALIEQKGNEVFQDFRKKGSKWFYDDIYVFIYTLNGDRLVFPPNITKEGKNAINVSDVNGKKQVKMFINKAKSNKGQGWVHYKWPKPGAEKPLWKSTFVKKATAPHGEIYVVCAGLYEMKTEKQFIIDIVNEAIDLLKKEGLSAFSKIGSKENEFIFYDSYVYIKDIKGNVLLNPAFPEFIGKNVYNYQDSNSKYFIRNEIEILKHKDFYWNEYMWPKPGEKTPSKISTFVKKAIIGQDTLIIGAGYFPE